MKTPLKALLTLIVACWAGFVAAQTLEVIELRSKMVEEVLPSLLPLVEPGGTLTGMNNQLFLRASPGNRADIKRALSAIDKPSRRLIIHVSQNRQVQENARGAEVQGQVVLGSTRRAQGEGSVWDTRSQRGERAAQRVQAVDGGRAFIQIGRSLPLPIRQVVLGPAGAVVSESIVYRDIGRGFYASPRVNRSHVTLEISMLSEQFDGRQQRGVQSQHLATTVSGQLGEWIELGGVGQDVISRQHGGFSVGIGDVHDNHSVWLMVEEAD